MASTVAQATVDELRTGAWYYVARAAAGDPPSTKELEQQRRRRQRQQQHEDSPAARAVERQLHASVSAQCLASSTAGRLTTALSFSATAPPLLRMPRCLFDRALGLVASLQTLDLSRNEMEELPPSVGDLAGLTTLDVSRNFLRRLPVELGRLRRLVTLDASSNDLRSLESLSLASIAKGCESLRVFDVQRNNKIGEKERSERKKGEALPEGAEDGLGHLEELRRVLGGGVEVRVTAKRSKEEQTHAADRDATLIRSQVRKCVSCVVCCVPFIVCVGWISGASFYSSSLSSLTVSHVSLPASHTSLPLY